MNSPSSLDGRVALVTGGGTGIGAGISSVLAARGARVVIVQPDQQMADERAERLRFDAACKAGADAGEADIRGIGADLATAAACADAVASCVGMHGRIDILVNNAAAVGPPASGDLMSFPDALLDTVIDVNLKAVFRCSRDAARHMTGTGGVIVNIASVGAFAAQYESSAYCASKAGVVGLTRGMAFELGPHGIRVVAVAPGDIDPDGDGSTPARNPYETGPRQWWERRSPLARRGAPGDIAQAVAFLCSAEASYITGATLVVDGGWLAY